MYKTKVQELCQKKQWRPPMYSTMKDGPDHHPRFNSSVSVNGLFFHSPFPSKSSKDAQNAAAKLAFLHFTGSSATLPSTEPIDVESNTTTETYYDDDHDPQIQSDALHVTLTDDFQSQYKGLLQNYAQQKNLDPPLYMSESDGPSHTICFKATVTVGVQTFESPMFFKTLKGAEQAAAKAALMSLSPDGFQKACGLSRSAEAASPSLVEDEALLTTSSTLTKTMESQQNLEDENHLLPSPIIKYKETSKEESTVDGIQEVGLMETLSSAAKFCTKDSSSSPAVLQLDQNTENGNSFSCPDSVPSSPKQGQLSSPNLAHPNFSALSNSDSNMKNVGTMSYLLCNRVRVYTSLPDIEFPKGITVLQIGDNKWVAVSLEFPNEEGN
nr:double-stranded rna-binding protein 1 [Quercus suber]